MTFADYSPYLPRELTDPLWRRLAGSRLFITGGTGLFGQWMLQSLEDANHRLKLDISAVLLSRQPQAFQAAWRGSSTVLSYVQGDVRSFEMVSYRFDHVIHMASTSATETYHGFSQLDKLDTLCTGTRRVLDYALACGARRFLFTSSGAAYGQIEAEPVRESEAGRIASLPAESALALGKMVAEFMCARYAESYGLETVAARCFSFVGPGLPLDVHYAIGNFIQDALAGREIVVRGDGSPVRSYMFLGDMTVWMLKLLLDGGAGEIYNVGSDEAISIADLAQRIAARAQRPVGVRVAGQKDYQVGVPARSSYVPSLEKARTGLGLDIYTGLDRALDLTFDYYRCLSPVLS